MQRRTGFSMRPRAATAAGAFAAALTIATAAGTFAATPGARSASAPACATSGLVIWLDTQGNGAAGSIYYMLNFTNLSGHACTLSGYPGVSAVDLAGHRIGAAASRDAAYAAHTVTLGNGHLATATLRIVESGNFPPSSCGPVTAAGLRVYPPNQTASKVVPFPFGACSHSTDDVLRVRALR